MPALDRHPRLEISAGEAEHGAAADEGEVGERPRPQERAGLLRAAERPQPDGEASESEPVSYTHLTLPTTPYV